MMGYPDHSKDSENERQIIDAILIAGLARNLTVSVYDGEEWSLKHSTDIEAIRAEVFATDMTRLRFRSPVGPGDAKLGMKFGERLGDVTLIHGNDCDVIHDHTDNPEMADLLKTAVAISDLIREGE